jgi:hypothetical protein
MNINHNSRHCVEGDIFKHEKAQKFGQLPQINRQNQPVKMKQPKGNYEYYMDETTKT